MKHISRRNARQGVSGFSHYPWELSYSGCLKSCLLDVESWGKQGRCLHFFWLVGPSSFPCECLARRKVMSSITPRRTPWSVPSLFLRRKILDKHAQPSVHQNRSSGSFSFFDRFKNLILTISYLHWVRSIGRVQSLVRLYRPQYAMYFFINNDSYCAFPCQDVGYFHLESVLLVLAVTVETWHSGRHF